MTIDRAARIASSSIGDALARAAASVPETEAIVCGAERLTYHVLERRARRAAAGLRARGIGGGERVAIWLPNGADWAVAFFASARLGTVVPVNARYRADELAVVLGHSRAAALIVAAGPEGARQRAVALSIADRVPGLRLVSTVPELEAEAGSAGQPIVPASPAIVQYTSGTTARPKGVVLEHGQVLRDAWELGARLDVRAGDRYASGMPFHHVGGSVLTLLLCATRLATAVALPRFDAREMLEALERERCTHVFLVESMCVMLLERPELDALDRSSLRVAFVGGRRAVLEAFRDRVCSVIVNRYGLTESSGNTCATEVGDPPEVALATMGRPLPGIEVRIVGGEIRVRGWAVTSGYLDDPAATAAAFDEDGWLRTGDLGEIDPDGRLRFHGRAGERLRVGSENVAEAEIEELVGRHPAVAQVAVVPLPDERLGEVPIAFVELRTGARAGAEELVEFCRARAAGFKVPRRVVFVAAGGWPMTGSGKIQKAALRDRARALPE